MKRRTFIPGESGDPGDGGFLFMDLLAALTILTILLLSLFALVRNQRLAYREERAALNQTLESWEQLLESPLE